METIYCGRSNIQHLQVKTTKYWQHNLKYKAWFNYYSYFIVLKRSYWQTILREKIINNNNK